MDNKKNYAKKDDSELHGVSISSVDILQQKFKVKLRGYDVQDVDSFLEIVAKEMERIGNENSRQQEELVTLRHTIEMYKKKEESINSALVTVQKLADDVKNRAAIESESLLNESRSEAERVLNDAKREAERILTEANQKNSEAQRESRDITDKAERESEKVIDAARQEASKIREEMKLEQSRIQEEINSLRQRKLQFQVSLKALIETHMKLMESEDDQPQQQPSDSF